MVAYMGSRFIHSSLLLQLASTLSSNCIAITFCVIAEINRFDWLPYSIADNIKWQREFWKFQTAYTYIIYSTWVNQKWLFKCATLIHWSLDMFYIIDQQINIHWCIYNTWLYLSPLFFFNFLQFEISNIFFKILLFKKFLIYQINQS